MSSATPPRATVEDFDDPDDPYAPYRPRQSAASGSKGARSSSASSADSAASSSQSSSGSAAPSSRTSDSSGSASSSYGYGHNTTASDIYERSASSGTQGTYPSQAGDEEPLFGGRPFRDAHDPSAAADTTSGDPSRAADKEYLYALLNVPADASPDAIKDAYRALAVVLHPDKHNDATRKSAAESRFREVQRAYEILSDPEKRVVYDHFGEEGLKSTWSVAVRGRSPHEMQAEFERERAKRQAADAEALVKSNGDFTAHIDATALFAHPSRIQRHPAQQRRASANGKKGRTAAEPAASAPGVAAMPGFGMAGFPRSVTMAERISQVGCTQLIGKHGFETQLTNRTSATFSGQMVSRKGLGGGNLVGTLKTHWSPRLFTEITLSFLRPQIVTTRGQYTLDANSFFSWQGTLQTLLMPPTFNVTYGQRLSAKSTLTGFTSVRSGTYSLLGWGSGLPEDKLVRREPTAVSVGLTKQIAPGRSWTAQTSISHVDQNISVDYALPVLGGVKLRTGFNIGTGSGISAFTSAERRLTENVRLALGLNCALNGITLRIRVKRLGQKIALPILLAREFRSDLIVLFTVVPAAAYTALHWGLLEPRKHRRLRNRLGELRAANRELILERRQAALDALALLRDPAAKKARAELARNGLVLISAVYGRKDAFPPALELADAREAAQQRWAEAPQMPAQNDEADLEDEAFWDVTIPVQALVNHGQLIVPAARSKAHLLGFHDPVIGEKKHLRVTYAFRGVLHSVEVADLAELAIPMRIHQVA